MADEKKQEAAVKPQSVEPQEKRYFIVNPAGAVHEVPREQAAARLRQGMGYRKATREEIERYLGSAEQRFDNPIAPRWMPDPDSDPEVD